MESNKGLHIVAQVGYGGFLKWWYPQIIHFYRVFHYKPSILGYPYFWKHPYASFLGGYWSLISPLTRRLMNFPLGFPDQRPARHRVVW